MRCQSDRIAHLLLENPRLFSLVAKGTITSDDAININNHIPLIGLDIAPNNPHLKDFKRGIITGQELRLASI